jgi:hypothetical protein
VWGTAHLTLLSAVLVDTAATDSVHALTDRELATHAEVGLPAAVTPLEESGRRADTAHGAVTTRRACVSPKSRCEGGSELR